MEPLPVEGTWFVSTWRSAADLPDGGPVGTAMLGLYCAGSRSLFHRLTHDEVWHHYRGDPLRLVLLHPDGSDEEIVLGGHGPEGLPGRVQFVVPAGSWQAGELIDGGEWALFGCTLAPGFTGTCFEGGTISRLQAAYPRRADDIGRLGVPDDHTTTLPTDFAT
jgi:predicted cupin superfamily sugar epimerase